MALGKKTSAVQENGSGKFYICECTAAGVTTGTFAEIGYISGTDFSDAISQTSVADETGRPIKNTDGSREITMAVKLMQKDKDSMYFNTKTSRGKYYHAVYKMNSDDEAFEGNDEYWVAGICQVMPETSTSTPGTAGPTSTFKPIANATALTLNATTVDAGLSAVAIPANEIWVIEQVAT